MSLEVDRNIDSLIGGMRPYIGKIFRCLARANPENAPILCDLPFAEQNERKVAESTKE